MAVRPLVNIERLTTAHVNSVDGSMTYESGVAYNANTTVSYNGSLYTANVDIEDTDTDTPDEAPDRWSLTINAPDTGTSGDISALAARVTALEETVGDETDGLVKDVDDLQTDVNKLKVTDNIVYNNYTYTAESGTTLEAAVHSLLDGLVTDVISGLEDNEYLVPIEVGLPLNATGSVRRGLACYERFFGNTQTTAISMDASLNRGVGSDVYIAIYAARLTGSTGSGFAVKSFRTSDSTFTDYGSVEFTADVELSLSYKIVTTV